MSTYNHSSSQAKVRQILDELKHLDLTGSVEYDLPKMPVARGGFGEVYRGRCNRLGSAETRVAIKRLTIYLDGSRDVARIFKREIKAWNRLKHPNVLPLVGYSLDESGDRTLVLPSLVSEWMDNGNILEFVSRHPGANIARLALGMAQGLAYLHENNIVHSDFKSANVLVSSAREAVVCDFGCSLVLHDLQSAGVSSAATGIRGTARWLAYELLADADHHPRPTKESDTWAFGMTIYEILTNGYPFAHIQHEAQVLVSIMTQKLPSPPTPLATGYKERLWDICTACWNYDPIQRPAISRITQQISWISEASYPVDAVASSEIAQKQRIRADDKNERFMHMMLSEFPFPELSLQGPEGSWTLFKRTAFVDYCVAQYRDSKVMVLRYQTYPSAYRLQTEWIAHEMHVLSMPGVRRHPNIQTLLGYCWENESQIPSLVFDYIGEQDLSAHVRENPQANILEMLLGVAKGLACIHDNDAVHGDIKSMNIFIIPDCHPVIVGFENCRELVPEEYCCSGWHGSTRWMAFEMLFPGNGIFMKERDIWTFGMTILELLSGELPYGHLKTDFQVMIAILKEILPQRPSSFDTWPQSRKLL